MRLRNKPWSKKLIEENPDYILLDPTDMAGRWQERFEKQHPIQLELGSGKGQFIIGMAQMYPEINFIAMEVQEGAIAFILRSQVELQLPNLQLVLANGRKLDEYFAENELDKMFLNFSDPWPKTRHEKRRLTYKDFLKQYKKVVKNDGYLQFKTDNQGLFEYSLASLNNFGMKYQRISLDLHNNEELMETNIQTEYEQKFTKKGQRIYYLNAQF
ncbi:tRNA (guanine-N(7)-)-methyltransferase [Companilactobacillus sp. RD055328]|uniref:tRNA (guanosine(46)-N7)-methyltransferase TrmB n=1 Tax=Companilactobacillus sp. RD055328 TaxID=2916634 RepID=UPI001FC8DE8C|nr:tRNA (guanosine(46)-N7)-methyltransferase TrmB [Companilactobacillus sp. RD055328]GKQ42495.1 tRNA (guanine-N(7)-)-methyltransferase [Companilactobacillus sp. RD055328]